MSARAVVATCRDGAPDLLVAYAEAVEAMAIGPEPKRRRLNSARLLVENHPDL